MAKVQCLQVFNYICAVSKQGHINGFQRWISWGIVLLGICILCFQYICNRSLFIDEANLALETMERSFASLFLSIGRDQFAPPLFLLLTKSLTEFLGNFEYVLRLPSLISGIMSIILLMRLLFNNHSWLVAGLVCLGLIINPTFVRYSTEFKQYSIDLFFCLLFVYLFLDQQKIGILLKSFLLVVAPWFSMPAIVVISSLFIVQWIAQKREFLKRKNILPYLLSAISFGIYYFINIRHSVGSEYLNSYHQNYFAATNPFAPNFLQQNAFILKEWFGHFGGFKTVNYIVVIPLFLIGCIVGLKRKLKPELFSLSVLAIVFLLSGLELYPMQARTLLFTQGVMCILIARGITSLINMKKGVIYLILLIWSVHITINKPLRFLMQKIEITDYKPSYEIIRQLAKPLFIEPNAKPSFSYYQSYNKSTHYLRDFEILDTPFSSDSFTILKGAMSQKDWIDLSNKIKKTHTMELIHDGSSQVFLANKN